MPSHSPYQQDDSEPAAQAMLGCSGSHLRLQDDRYVQGVDSRQHSRSSGHGQQHPYILLAWLSSNVCILYTVCQHVCLPLLHTPTSPTHIIWSYCLSHVVVEPASLHVKGSLCSHLLA